jgi:hypothetical protein
LRGFDDDVDVFPRVISPVHGFSVFHSTDQIVHHLRQALNIPVKVPIGGGRYAELTEWNGSKRVDLRFWKTDTKTLGHSSLRRMQCPFSIRHEVLPDVNSQLRGFDEDVDVFSHGTIK